MTKPARGGCSEAQPGSVRMYAWLLSNRSAQLARSQQQLPMASTIPGAYETTPSENSSDDLGLDTLLEADSAMDSDDADFQPASDTADEVSMDEEEEEEDGDAAGDAGGQLQIAFDRVLLPHLDEVSGSS